MANNILTSANRRRESSSIALVVIVLGSQDRIDAWEEAVMDYLPPARRRAMAQAVGCDLSQSELAVQNPVVAGRNLTWKMAIERCPFRRAFREYDSCGLKVEGFK